MELRLPRPAPGHARAREGRELVRRGRAAFREAGLLVSAAWARERSSAGDVVNFVFLDGLEAVLLAGRGKHAEADGRTRRGLVLVETTDFFELRSWSRLMLAETCALSDRTAEAAALGADAVGLHEAKGDVAGATLGPGEAGAHRRRRRLNGISGRC